MGQKTILMNGKMSGVVCRTLSHIYTYILIVLWRGSVTPSYIRRVMGKGGVTRYPSDDDSSKQNNWKRDCLSSTLSIITRWHGHRRTSLSICHVCISGGEADLWPWLVLIKKPPKANTWWIFKLQKLISCYFIAQGWGHIKSFPVFVEKLRT